MTRPAVAVLVREIRFGSKEHAAEVRLRTEVLREPLGLSYSEAELERESSDVHLGAFLDGGLAGCLLLRPASKDAVKMRQVAVAPGLQGKGIGKALVRACEVYAQDHGYAEIELHARATAVPFYKAMGYEVAGEPFEEVGLPHRRMRKYLALR